jgi:hypothetical protein
MWIGGAIRTLARGASVGSFSVALCGCIYYPRPWCSNWDVQKIVAFDAIYLGALAAFVSLLLCGVSACFRENTSLKRPLWPYVALDAMTFVILFSTPCS